jgi:hypothetical protein
MTARRRSIRLQLAVLSLAWVWAAPTAIRAQQPAVAQGGAAQATAAQGSLYQRYAPVDLTGTWVSVVTEDWAVRMITPPKGDFDNLPLTKAAQDAAARADMAQVAASGRACDAYGAPVVMREPGRVRISWQDGSTLRIDTDAGEQTRLLHFGGGEPPRGAPSRQGYSAAEWQYANGFDPLRAGSAAAPAGDGRGAGGGRGAGAGRGGAGGRGAPASAPSGGRLKVVTTHLSPGLLRKNGVPYSMNTTVTEYYNQLTEPDGTRWFVVTTVVHDPENLVVDFITSTNFRKEPDASKWRPSPCTVR